MTDEFNNIFLRERMRPSRYRDRDRDIEREVATAMISVLARIARKDISGLFHG